MALLHEKAMRGRTRTGWLNSHHTFSFGNFSDPSRMGHRALRVINEDVVIPGAGFGEHGHEEMDILTYVVSGALRHQDSLGNVSVIREGEIQHMYAGTGVEHSEMNASDTEPAHFLQVWIVPKRTGGTPSYFQATVQPGSNVFAPVAGPEVREGCALLRSDTGVFMARLNERASVHHDFAPGRAGFLQVVSGLIDIAGNGLSAGDGLQFDATERCEITARSKAELLLFDLA